MLLENWLTISSGAGNKTMMEERARSTETPLQARRHIPLDTGLKEYYSVTLTPKKPYQTEVDLAVNVQTTRQPVCSCLVTCTDSIKTAAVVFLNFFVHVMSKHNGRT